MSNPLPSVTVLIPARVGQGSVLAVPAAKALDYPPELVEVLVVRGRQPSAQRNTGLREAKGDLVYFLDDDSQAQPGNLRRAVEHFTRPEVQMVGGPNVCPPGSPLIEQVFALVLTAWLAFGPSRARYAPVGSVRETSEKELILCNLMARRKPLLELGGFDESLYPNEENALMDELQKRGGKLLYDPGFAAFRRPRPNLKAFARMLMTYGRGRAEQFRQHPTPGSALNFAPPLFCVYILLLSLTPVVGSWLLLPLAFYLLAVLMQGLVLIKQGGLVRGVLATPFIILTHILYGMGFWRGIFTSLRPAGSKAPVEVALERVS